MRKITIVPAFLLLILLVSGVSAQTISFATIDATTQDVYMYAANGSLLSGVYNTTSTGIPLPPDTDLIFTIKPHTANPLDDPGAFLQSGFSYIKTNAIPIIIVIFLAAIVFGRRH